MEGHTHLMANAKKVFFFNVYKKNYILHSRFTEENFACLIAFIFIKKAIDKVVHISDHAPLHESPCNCIPENDTFAELFPMQMDFIGKI